MRFSGASINKGLCIQATVDETTLFTWTVRPACANAHTLLNMIFGACRYHYNVANSRVEQHVEKGNDDGLYISSVACCQELWALIMDAGTGFSAQVPAEAVTQDLGTILGASEAMPNV